MSICYKRSDTRNLQLFFLQMRITISDRKNLHFRIARHRMIETDPLPIHQDHVNFRMWHTARLNYIFHGRFLRDNALDYSAAYVGSEKETKITMKTKPDRKWRHVS